MNDAGGAVLVILVVIGLIVGAVVFGGQALERAAADRDTARADRTRAEAAAYSERLQAASAAAAERAAIREAGRQAGHERVIELLPFVLVIAGAGLLCVVLLFVAWDIRTLRATAPAGTDPAILSELRRLELARLENDRQMWRAIAALDRRSLPGQREGVILYSESERR